MHLRFVGQALPGNTGELTVLPQTTQVDLGDETPKYGRHT